MAGRSPGPPEPGHDAGRGAVLGVGRGDDGGIHGTRGGADGRVDAGDPTRGAGADPAAGLHDRGRGDVGAGDWRQLGDLQRGQRGRARAAALSGLRRDRHGVDGVPHDGFRDLLVSPPEFLELQERARSFAVLGGYRGVLACVGRRDRPERVQGAVATAEVFEALGIDARLGRTFGPDDDRPGADPVVVLSHDLWQRTFGGDRSILGRGIDVNGVRTTVVGVMPPDFDLNDEGIEIWQPLGLDRANRDNRGSHFLNLVGRLADGVSVIAARRELSDLVAGWQEASPEAG
ncbi:MAG: ABC transporter permease, partial [Longimicrobiales bacterium]